MIPSEITTVKAQNIPHSQTIPQTHHPILTQTNTSTSLNQTKIKSKYKDNIYGTDLIRKKTQNKIMAQQYQWI